MRRVRSWLGWLLFVLAGARTWAGEGLTVLTWNVQNYVAEDRMVDGEYRTDFPKPEREKAALRAALREVDADVLALQEMGPEPYLEELQRDLAGEGSPYPYRALLDGPDPKRHLALLSRVRFVRVVPHREVGHDRGGRSERVRRGVLEATLEVAGREWTVFVVHLKSRHTDDPRDPFAAEQRLGEAEAVRELVLARTGREAGARFLLVGDCNDDPASRPVRALQRRGGTVLAQVVPATDARGDAWTHHYRKKEVFSRVDYILVSPALGDEVARAWVHDSAAVRAASDHRPVVVRLAVPR